jgi:aspartate 1-decarboxylase
MVLNILQSKIHRVPVTECDMNYNGSISIDANWLSQARILPNQQVDVLNINNGARFTTYVIEAPRGSQTIGINGAAARLAQIDDLVIVIAYAQMHEDDARQYVPNIISPMD